MSNSNSNKDKNLNTTSEHKGIDTSKNTEDKSQTDHKPVDEGLNTQNLPAQDNTFTEESEKPHYTPEEKASIKANTRRFLAEREKRGGHFKIKLKNKMKKAFKSKYKRVRKSIDPKANQDFFSKLKDDVTSTFIYLSKKEHLKSLISNKQNIAVGLSAIALAVAVCTAISASSSNPIDKDNAFIKLTEVTPQSVGVPAKSLHSSDETYNLDPDRQGQQGMVFLTEKDFKEAVGKALAQLRHDKVLKDLDNQYQKNKLAPEKTTKNARIYGNPQSRFVIYEYSDIECPYCKTFSFTPKEVVDISEGQVSLQWRHFPLDFHNPKATQEAIATQCAFQQKGNRGFWVALDKLFNTTKSNGQGSTLLNTFDNEMNLNSGEYLNCINDKATYKVIEEDKKLAMADGVSSTPSVVIVDTLTGRRETLSGAVPAQQIIDAIESLNSQSVEDKPIQTSVDNTDMGNN